jgi:phage FluMu gp28-like protein
MSASAETALLKYQRDWIADLAPVKVWEKSRRIGATWSEAADAALAAAKTGGEDSWYIGYNKDMALEFIETAADWTRKFHHVAEQIEETVIADDARDILAFRIRFASGNKVVALSSRPSNLRGKQGRAIIDEAAFHDDLGGLLKAALAFTMWGGRVHVISTHNGADNPFNELVTDCRAGRKPYSLHRTTLDNAIEDGLFRAICRVRAARAGRDERSDDVAAWSLEAEQAWRAEVFADYGDDADEELLCIPNQSSGVFLPSVLIESRMNPEIPILRWEMKYSFIERGEHALKKDCEDWINGSLTPALGRLDPKLLSCFGEDFGRSGDLTVIWPLQMGQRLIRRTPFLIELRNIPFNQQRDILFHLVDHLPRFIGGATDARGNGQYLAEVAQQRYGARVEAVMLSTEWYRDNMPRYKAAFEDANIELPQDADILNDHRMLRMEKGVAKIPDRRIRGEGGGSRHGDSAIAGALAWYASNSNHQESAYTPIAGLLRNPFRESSADDDSPRLGSRYGSHGVMARALTRLKGTW